jgi:hypothetical protein
MKTIVAFLLAGLFGVAFITGSCMRNTSGGPGNQASDTTGTAIMTFSALEHDFGKVKEGEKVGCIFTFTNSGDADLVITSASASCGCTVAKYDRKPIPPGDGGTIEVAFDTSGRDGIQTKTVVIQSNAEQNLVILRIIADVMKKKE